MTKRRWPSPHRCPFCGGPAEADCVDNRGKPYKGCSSGCRIKSLEEINTILRAGGEEEIKPRGTGRKEGNGC